VTWRKIDTEEGLERIGHDEEMRERLEDLGYLDGGHVYVFHTPLSGPGDLDDILAEIREGIGKNFTEGDDGHATISGDELRVVSKEELSELEVREIDGIVS